MAVGRPKGRSVSWVCVLRARIAVEEDNLLGQFPDRRSVERLERESVRQSFRQLATGFFPSPAGGIQAVPPYRPCQANVYRGFVCMGGRTGGRTGVPAWDLRLSGELTNQWFHGVRVFVP